MRVCPASAVGARRRCRARRFQPAQARRCGAGRVGHLQIAGVPERHEPDVGELNYAYLFELIDSVSAQCGWQGWLGCEYRPRRGAAPGATSAGLDWLRAARAAVPGART